MSDVCAVIGAGPGIGFAVAKRFGAGGMKVALMARRRAEVENMADELLKLGVDARAYSCDAERATDITDALNNIEHALGPVSALIYNAAVIKPGGAQEVGVEQLVRELRVDVGGALVAAQRVVPQMKEAGRGTIILTGGGLALDPWPQMTSLSIGKAGMRTLALCLHKELAPFGIHAATVTVAGLVEKGRGHFDPDAIAQVYWELHEQPREKFEAERVIR
jgi:NAD(P)-dependent dehydrogenase (short-subunit alcohol dehydrogenase family)